MDIDSRIGRAAIVVTVALIAMVALTAYVARRSVERVEIPAAWSENANYTLIILGRTSCAACAASAAFHTELAAAASANGVRVIAAATASSEDAAAFAASIGLTPDHAVAATPPPKGISTVPSIVIVDRAGTVLRKTEGALTVDDQRPG